MKKSFLAFIAGSLLSSALHAAGAPQPPALAFVIHHRGITLTKHPAKPILYMTCTAAMESKNLVTLQLDASGNVLTNTARSFNFFDSDPTNQQHQHAIVRPALLAEESILYLAVQPDYPAYFAITNHQQIAAVALDTDGQPAKLLRSFRTAYSAQGIHNLQWEPTTRRLYVSYGGNFGWMSVDKDGATEPEKFNVVNGVYECWDWAFVPAWQRFYLRQTRTNAGLTLFKVSANGLTAELVQNFGTHTRSDSHLAISPELHRAYYLDRGAPGQLVSFQLTGDGRITGVAHAFDLGDAVGMRFDFARQRLYVWAPDSILRTYSLNDRGLPMADPHVSALGCGEIRDVIVDPATGKLYVLGTQPVSTT